jgi:hypothetical protein
MTLGENPSSQSENLSLKPEGLGSKPKDSRERIEEVRFQEILDTL